MTDLKGLPPMARGLGQVLFNYLPEATFDYDKGSCICKVAEVRINTEKAEGIDHRRILADIAQYVSRWEGFSTLKPEHTYNSNLFAFGEPEDILFNIYPLVFECRKCRAAFSYQSEEQFLKDRRNYQCRWCGGRLGQIYHVLVHQCGEMKQLWVPSCQNPVHGNRPTRVRLDSRGSQKAMDFRWVCLDCGAAIPRPIHRSCDRCSGSEEDKEGNGSTQEKTMRPIPHRANAAYYAHHLRRVNVTRQDVQALMKHPEKERILVQAYLNEVYRTEDLLRNVIEQEESFGISQQMFQRARSMPEGPSKDKLLSMAEAMSAMEATEPKVSISRPVGYQLSQTAVEELFDYVKLRGSCRISSLDDLKLEKERRQPGTGRGLDLIRREYLSSGFKEISLVSDFPIVTAVFGYTRVSADPQLKIGDRSIRTTFRNFPTLRMSREALQDKIPIFTRVAETEGLLVRLDPLRVLRWLDRLVPGTVGSPKDERDAKLWLLQNIGDVDRFVTMKEMSEPTRHVFTLVHTIAHILIRAAGSLAGLDRTGFSEYLFPRIGAFVIYNTNTEFNLGGITSLYEEELDVLLRKTKYDPLAKECVYDPVCREQLGSSCHACTHLGEMACAFFNRGMSRDYLFGPMGFWGM